MVEILEAAPRRPKFAEQLSRGFQQAAGEGIPKIAEHLLGKERRIKQSLAYKELGLPEKLIDLPEEQQREFIKAQLTGKAQKQLEKENALQLGIETAKKMKGLLPYAGGFTSAPFTKLQSYLPGETQKKRAELETLGRSLIPLVAAGVPIRNQKEFEEYRKIITDPDSSPTQFEGALDGLIDLFERSLAHSEESVQKRTEEKKMKFNPTNPEHQAKAKQLYQHYKDKAKVRKELEREFEF